MTSTTPPVQLQQSLPTSLDQLTALIGPSTAEPLHHFLLLLCSHISTQQTSLTHLCRRVDHNHNVHSQTVQELQQTLYKFMGKLQVFADLPKPNHIATRSHLDEVKQRVELLTQQQAALQSLISEHSQLQADCIALKADISQHTLTQHTADQQLKQLQQQFKQLSSEAALQRQTLEQRVAACEMQVEKIRQHTVSAPATQSVDTANTSSTAINVYTDVNSLSDQLNEFHSLLQSHSLQFSSIAPSLHVIDQLQDTVKQHTQRLHSITRTQSQWESELYQLKHQMNEVLIGQQNRAIQPLLSTSSQQNIHHAVNPSPRSFTITVSSPSSTTDTHSSLSDDSIAARFNSLKLWLEAALESVNQKVERLALNEMQQMFERVEKVKVESCNKRDIQRVNERCDGLQNEWRQGQFTLQAAHTRLVKSFNSIQNTLTTLACQHCAPQPAQAAVPHFCCLKCSKSICAECCNVKCEAVNKSVMEKRMQRQTSKSKLIRTAFSSKSLQLPETVNEHDQQQLQICGDHSTAITAATNNNADDAIPTHMKCPSSGQAVRIPVPALQLHRRQSLQHDETQDEEDSDIDFIVQQLKSLQFNIETSQAQITAIHQRIDYQQNDVAALRDIQQSMQSNTADLLATINQFRTPLNQLHVSTRTLSDHHSALNQRIQRLELHNAVFEAASRPWVMQQIRDEYKPIHQQQKRLDKMAAEHKEHTEATLVSSQECVDAVPQLTAPLPASISRSCSPRIDQPISRISGFTAPIAATLRTQNSKKARQQHRVQAKREKTQQEEVILRARDGSTYKGSEQRRPATMTLVNTDSPKKNTSASPPKTAPPISPTNQEISVAAFLSPSHQQHTANVDVLHLPHLQQQRSFLHSPMRLAQQAAVQQQQLTRHSEDKKGCHESSNPANIS